jgi:hypothetical protein
MKTEWQFIDFNNFDDKIKKLASFSDDLKQKIKVGYLLISKLNRMTKKSKAATLEI